ncbi:AsnC family transcriptional regulator [Nocardia sp. NPDC046763]|uniref:Lrp/AsnC family transcriptional regulator n=1 Tax=Nocardia sp. NPDC046763 TaxID=3155256 RepID=UPI0033F6DCD7
MDSVGLDEIDLGLMHALQIDGRAPFSRIGEVLGVSDRTVARRFARLKTHGLVRVTGVVDTHQLGYAEWLVRVRVCPDGALGLAQALARRPDTSWVSILSSGTEIMCLFRIPAGGPAPLADLARRPQILDVTAQQMLQHLTHRRWAGRTSALGADQVAALLPSDPVDSRPVTLTELDRRLLPWLAMDGRAGYPELARRTAWSESSIRRRVEDLRRSAVLRFDVEVDATRLGYTMQCLLRLTVTPARLLHVAETLAADPQTAFVGATTGDCNLFTVVVCRDATDLLDYLTHRLGTVDGIDHVETVPITAYTKRSAPTR